MKAASWRARSLVGSRQWLSPLLITSPPDTTIGLLTADTIEIPDLDASPTGRTSINDTTETSEEFDFIVVGSGAGGGLLASPERLGAADDDQRARRFSGPAGPWGPVDFCLRNTGLLLVVSPDPNGPPFPPQAATVASELDRPIAVPTH